VAIRPLRVTTSLALNTCRSCQFLGRVMASPFIGLPFIFAPIAKTPIWPLQEEPVGVTTDQTLDRL
jgi:hypothetical protein